MGCTDYRTTLLITLRTDVLPPLFTTVCDGVFIIFFGCVANFLEPQLHLPIGNYIVKTDYFSLKFETLSNEHRNIFFCISPL